MGADQVVHPTGITQALDDLNMTLAFPPLKLLRLREGNPLANERTANPVQTNAFFGVNQGFLLNAVDAGFPLQHSNFPHRPALSSAG